MSCWGHAPSSHPWRRAAWFQSKEFERKFSTMDGMLRHLASKCDFPPFSLSQRKMKKLRISRRLAS